MNSFEHNQQVQESLLQTIHNLQLIVSSNRPFSTLEKDILLQCIRKLYLLTLKYVPQDDLDTLPDLTLAHAESPAAEDKVSEPVTPSISQPIYVQEPEFVDSIATPEQVVPASQEPATPELPAEAATHAEPTPAPDPVIEEEEVQPEPASEPTPEPASSPNEPFEKTSEIIDFLAARPADEPQTPAQPAPAQPTQLEPAATAAPAQPSHTSGLLFGEEEMQKVAQPTAKRSLNDVLIEQKKENMLADKLRQSKVEDLSKAIGINDKFLYIKELFKNDGENFSQAITTLNNCTTIEEAMDELYMLSRYYAWDLDSDTYASFFDLVNRKFL